MNSRSTMGGFDWVLILLYLVMVVFGWLNIFAAGFNSSFTHIFNMNTTYGNQAIWIIISFIAILTIIILDHKIYHFFAYFFYGAAMLLLLSVLVVGTEVNGAKSWIRFGGFTLQPSEFAKIGTCLALARYLSGYQITKFTLKTVSICAGIIGLPFF
ncbi:MAG: FtsW/RodA/SpoVE family cell cycle protein [Bacteroidales bacterium]|nr:FtsW/RodA/SpoVE family cell cycle protein [Bacteroidales bacterium]